MGTKQAEVKVRVSGAEKAEWEALAKESGLTLSKWIRMRCNAPAGMRKVASPKSEWEDELEMAEHLASSLLDPADPALRGIVGPCCEPVFIGGKRKHQKGCARA